MRPVEESFVGEHELDEDALRKMACANSREVKQLKAHHQLQKAALQEELTELANMVGESNTDLTVSRNDETGNASKSCVSHSSRRKKSSRKSSVKSASMCPTP